MVNLTWSQWWSTCKANADHRMEAYAESLASVDFVEWCDNLHPETLLEVIEFAPVEIICRFAGRLTEQQVTNLMRLHTTRENLVIGAAWVRDRRQTREKFKVSVVDLC